MKYILLVLDYSKWIEDKKQSELLTLTGRIELVIDIIKWSGAEAE